MIRMPSAFYMPVRHPHFNWGYVSEPERTSMADVCCVPGRLLRLFIVNGMVYVRGHAGDFDRWAELGADGWHYESVLPYFRSAEICWRCTG